MMGTTGYLGYRYKRKYYLQYAHSGSYPSGYGQQFADTVPRDPSTLREWMAGRINILENAETSDMKDQGQEMLYPDDDTSADKVGFQVTYDPGYTFCCFGPEWSYVIDLDNLTFTINSIRHLGLDKMHSCLNEYTYFSDELPIPSDCLKTAVDLWPAPDFDVEDRQKEYEALQPIVIPATEWSAPAWDELTMSQRVSIEITDYLLRKTSH
ncbi:unnamed protein product [Rhizoctonia solani]|uniref:Uncharacterized protein n=1 Tax=Rhizoctonia solani TaxID=456999 RepID=A0A8H3GZN0_9AGAM|nr:unnamed protein product [Rhizoctonia solani]